MGERLTKFRRLKVDDCLDHFLDIYKKKLCRKDFLSLLCEYGVERLYIDEFEQETEEYLRICNNINIQNEKIQIVEKEIEKLSTIFDRVNISLVTLKGVTLAYEIYKENLGMRKSRDIDIFVSPKDIEKTLDILGDNGYCVRNTGEKVSRCLCEKYQNKMLSSIHFTAFEKSFLVNGETIKIPMDCHISIVHVVENRDILMNQMVERAESIRLKDNPVRILELHDRILHLISHMMKEYFRNRIRWNINGEKHIYKELRFPLNLLHEIARMIELNNERIDWGVLVDRAQKYSLNDEFWGAMKLLNNIYYHLIPRNIINSINENIRKCNENSLGQYYALSLISESEEDVLNQSLDEASANVVCNLLDKTEYKFGESYMLSSVHSNRLVHGCEIVDGKSNHAVSKILLTYTNDNLIIQLEKNDSFIGKKIVITVSSGFKNKFSKAFIDRFICDIGECNSYGDTSLYICNAHIDVVLKECVHITEDKIIIKLPISCIGNLNMEDKKEIFIDVDLPDLFGLYDAGIPKYKINPFHSVSAYMHNPCFLKKFVIQ